MKVSIIIPIRNEEIILKNIIRELENKLGTKFYKIGLYTKGGILLNPGKLVRSMVDVLPGNVELFEISKSYLKI